MLAAAAFVYVTAEIMPVGALPAIARDMERCLGRADVHPSVTSLPALVTHVMNAVGASHATAPVEASA